MCSCLRLDVLLLFSCCFVMTRQQTNLWCFDSDELCYTVYTTPRVQAAADVECQQRHTNGRLVTILDSTYQTRLDYDIKRQYNRLLEYWIGARLQGLSEWTWVNNQPFEDTAKLSIPENQHNVKGYVTIRKVPNGVRMTVVPLSDPLCQQNARYHDHALCERRDRNEYGRFYLTAGRNWHEARRHCTYGNADLAVLTDADISVQLLTTMKQDFYFIGLTNVRLIWSVGAGQAKVSTYFNWVDTAAWSHEEDACVYASITAPYGDSKWNTSYCNIPRPFICEYANPKHASLAASTRTTTTSATATTSETERKTSASLTETEQSSTFHGGSNDKLPQSGEFMRILLGGLILLILAAVVVIVGVIFYFKRKSLQSASYHRRQPQSYTNLQMQNTYDECQPQYAAVHQPNVPDVCFGTTAGNRPGESDQYAEVGGSTIATDDGTQYANLPAGLPQTQAKKRKKKQHASAPTIHLSAATSVSEAANNAGGTVYASIVPTVGSQQTDRAEDNEYEMPTQPVVYASLDSC